MKNDAITEWKQTYNGRSLKIPDEAYILAEKYQLGKPIAKYGTGLKRKLCFNLCVITSIFIIASALSIGEGKATLTTLLLLIPLLFLPVLLLLFLIFLPEFLHPRTRVYVFSDGFVYIKDHVNRMIHWEQVEKVDAIDSVRSNSLCKIYLIDGTIIKFSRPLENTTRLGRSIKYYIAKYRRR